MKKLLLLLSFVLMPAHAADVYPGANVGYVSAAMATGDA
jgi:hypothetical protein